MFLSLGSAAENCEAAVDHLRQTRGASVGSIHLNVFRPFPERAVVEALAGKKNVIILERTDEPLAGDNPMGRDTRTALNKGASCENHVRPNFCLRRRGERGQRTGRSICRRRVSATVAREPETRGFMEPACR